MTKSLSYLLIAFLIFSCTPTRNTNNSDIKSSSKKTESPFKEIGTLSNKKTLVNMLQSELNVKIDGSKPIVIIYYVEKTKYNSSGGFVKRSWAKKWKKDLEKELNLIANVEPLYLYNNYEGLEIHEGIIPWKKDPHGKIMELFFEGKSAWLSFVVISKDGEFINHSGEFPLELLFEATKFLNQ